MEEKLTEEMHIWCATFSTRISSSYYHSSGMGLHLLSEDNPCMRLGSINYITSYSRLSQLCGSLSSIRNTSRMNFWAILSILKLDLKVRIYHYYSSINLNRSKLRKIQILALDLLRCLSNIHAANRYFPLNGGRCSYIWPWRAAIITLGYRNPYLWHGSDHGQYPYLEFNEQPHDLLEPRDLRFDRFLLPGSLHNESIQAVQRVGGSIQPRDEAAPVLLHLRLLLTSDGLHRPAALLVEHPHDPPEGTQAGGTGHASSVQTRTGLSHDTQTRSKKCHRKCTRRVGPGGRGWSWWPRTDVPRVCRPHGRPRRVGVKWWGELQFIWQRRGETQTQEVQETSAC